MFDKLSRKYGVANPLGESSNQVSFNPSQTTTKGKQTDFKALLTQFYQKHNPSKIAEVEKTLDRYKVSLSSF